MLQNFLKEAISLAVGKQSEQISDILSNTKYINEFTIAKKLDMTINQTRNILYKLSDFGLVSYIRKKDKKKGWFTYFWKLEAVKVLEFLKGIKKKNIDQIEHQIKSRETKSFYICQKCNIEFTEENALFHDFSCIECGQLLTMVDSSKILKDLKRSLNKFKDESETINDQILKEKEKVEKIKVRQIKKEAKKKKPAKKKSPAKKKTLKKTKKTATKKLLKKTKNVKKTLKKTKKISVKAKPKKHKKTIRKITSKRKPKPKKFKKSSSKGKKLSGKKK